MQEDDISLRREKKSTMRSMRSIEERGGKMSKRFIVCDHLNLTITYNLPTSISYYCDCGAHDIVWISDLHAELVCSECGVPEEACDCEEESA